jgi:SAM-dependent methyltransferase
MEFKDIKDNSYSLFYESSSIKCDCNLGTIESDACGLFGKFTKENFRAEKIFNIFIEKNFQTVLDIGAGKLEATEKFIENGKHVDICDFDDGLYYKNTTCDKDKINNLYLGDFLDINFEKKYDAIWCSHVLEHQLNPNIFLKKINSLIKEDGYLCIIVPIRKPIIVGGHVSIWNAGLLLYHLVHANFDCSNPIIYQYDYNIGIIIKKKTIILPKLHYDIGDIYKLKKFFPPQLNTQTDSFNGDILKLNI